MKRFAYYALVAGVISVLSSCSGGKKDSSDEHFQKGNDFIYKSDFANAQKEYEKAIESNKNNTRALYALATVFELQGELGKSLEYYKALLEADSTFALGYFGRANVEQAIGLKPEFQKDIDKAIHFKPDFFMALLSRSRAKLGTNNYVDAKADLDAAINIKPTYVMLYEMRGTAKMKLNDVDGAIADFTQQIKLDSNAIAGYANRSVAYDVANKDSLAIKDISRALKSDPMWGQGYIYRAMFKHKIKDNDACHDLAIAKTMRLPMAEQYIKEYCK